MEQRAHAPGEKAQDSLTENTKAPAHVTRIVIVNYNAIP